MRDQINSPVSLPSVYKLQKEMGWPQSQSGRRGERIKRLSTPRVKL